MFTKDIGIDLGTANTLVYMKGRGIIMREGADVTIIACGLMVGEALELPSSLLPRVSTPRSSTCTPLSPSTLT